MIDAAGLGLSGCTAKQPARRASSRRHGLKEVARPALASIARCRVLSHNLKLD